MSYGAMQDPPLAAASVATPGLVVNELKADISSNFAVETALGIGPGLVVSRGTDAENQVVVGGADASKVLGITCRIADNNGSPATPDSNDVIWPVNDLIPVMHAGYVWAQVTGSGNAGSTLINYNVATGAIDLGAPGEGEAALYGVQLWNTVSGGGLALLKLTELRGDPGYVTSVALNGGEGATGDVDLDVITGVELNGTEITPTAGVVDVEAITEVGVNGTPLVPTDGAVDVEAITDIEVNGTALVPVAGAVDFVDGTGIDLTGGGTDTCTVATAS